MRENYPTVERLEKVIGKERREKLHSIEVQDDVVEVLSAYGYVDPNYPRIDWVTGHWNYQYDGGRQTKKDLYESLKRFCDHLEYDLELYKTIGGSEERRRP